MKMGFSVLPPPSTLAAMRSALARVKPLSMTMASLWPLTTTALLSVGDKPTDLVTERVDLAVRITNTLDPTMITRPLARCRSLLCASPD